MTPAATGLSEARPFAFDDGPAYELMMGRWSALVAEPFLAWLGLPLGLAWLDAGCGDGSFTEILVRRQRPASVVGVDPAPAQLAYARQRPAAAQVRYLQGDAQALPLPGNSTDVGVMALVLFFLADPAQGLRELTRVVRPGGTVAAYHWDIEGGGLPLQPVIAALRAEGYRSELPPSAWAATQASSTALWRDAELVDVQTRQFEVHRRFVSFDDYWSAARGSPRLRALLASISVPEVERLSERVRVQLGADDSGPLVVKARANAIKGRRA
ncbi:MAG: hypothetical protein RIQ60_1164 [Pseudomonadota bacterium]|jgi:SAM-dependent methyltransferase